MIPLLAFLELRDSGRPDFYKKASNHVENDYDFIRSLDDKIRNEKGKWVERGETEKDRLIEAYKAEKKVELTASYDKKKILEWESIIQRENRYKQPLIINRDLIGEDLLNTFILPMMMSPGKHNIFVFTDEQGSLKANYNRHIGPCRKELIPHFHKQLKSFKIVREFKLKESVFACWKVDDSKVLDTVLKHDTRFWKPDRHSSPDGRGLAGVANVIKKNWNKINEVFLLTVAKSNFPTIDLPGFSRFL